ncbi:MAG: tetratricopeptide repeat protein [Patescibacteria group bacterium]|nr:tetratricopeptide repeat protein [Patescibacteria group bacterium]
MIYWICLIVLVIAVVVIAVIIFRKFSHLAIIDVDTMIHEKQAKIKEDIIWRRVARKTKERSEPIISVASEIKRGVGVFLENIYKRAKVLEKKYAMERRASKASRPVSAPASQIGAIVSEAESLFDQGKMAEAEEKYIEAIGIDGRNPEAYWGLGKVYIETKQFDEAKQSLDFLIKLGKADDRVYETLGDIAFSENRYKDAKEYYLIAIARNDSVVKYYLSLAKTYAALDDRSNAQSTLFEAREIEPKNPKTLDFLIENSIILGNKEQAQRIFEEFRALNPENPKFSEWEMAIEKMKK